MPTRGFTLWFTGLPCSGKTTLSDLIEKELRENGQPVEHLDGDLIRQELSKDLGFSKEHRDINIERASFVASLLTRNGVATLVSFVSPYRKTRQAARERIGAFIELFVYCPLEVCEKRDVKGMYKLARAGKIRDFTGVSDPYEEPENPEIRVDTSKAGIEECKETVLTYLEARNWILPRNPFRGNELLTKAFETAKKFHYGQFREGGLPYVTHPVAAAKKLRVSGYGDEVVAAALLHDVLEDSGCEREKMERLVGERVTSIVLEITDKDKTAPWKERKAGYLATLERASQEALAVACADKAHNLECLVEGYRSGGETFAGRFSGSFPEKIENYRRIYEVIAAKAPSCKLLPEFRRHLDGLVSAAGAAKA